MLASHCGHVTEFGVRTGRSTAVFAQGLVEGMRFSGRRDPATLRSYDIKNYLDLGEFFPETRTEHTIR